MKVTVQGRNVDVSPTLRATAQEKISRLTRFLDDLESAEIHFLEEKNPRISDKEVCEVTLRGRGHLIRAKAAAADSLASVERVVDKLEHQIQKLKSRKVSRVHHRGHESVNSRNQANPDDDGEVGDDEAGDEEDRRFRIVKSKQFSIKPMTPEEAALQMDLLGHDFYFFTNADTERAAVVYRRSDGQVGLIDAS